MSSSAKGKQQFLGVGAVAMATSAGITDLSDGASVVVGGDASASPICRWKSDPVHTQADSNAIPTRTEAKQVQ